MSVAETTAPSEAARSITSLLVTLLTVAIFINYVDRGNLATAAPLIKDELHLSNTQLGLMTSAFFWTYTPAIVLAGWLADRINPYRTFALGFAVWSTATALTGLVSGFFWLFVLRFLLGLGESAAFPCSSKLLANYLPPHRLGAANGLLIAGVAWGPAFGTLVGGLLMARYGWRMMFLTFGIAAFLWLWPWLSATRQAPPPTQTEVQQPPPPYRVLLSLRPLWGATIGHFASNYVLYFVLSWMPLYLVKARGFTIVEMAQIGAVIYAVQGISSVAFGVISDRWIAAGASINRVRKVLFIAGLVGIAVSFAGVIGGGSRMAIASFVFGAVCMGTNGTSLWSATQTLAGPHAAARWVSIQNALANFAGILAPIVTGVVIDRTGSFNGAFFVAAVVAIAGAAAWVFIIGRIEPVNWKTI